VTGKRVRGTKWPQTEKGNQHDYDRATSTEQSLIQHGHTLNEMVEAFADGSKRSK
jgi:hypothetical protein